MQRFQLDVVVTRGDAVESEHQVSAAVVDSADRLVGQSGDPDLVTFWRSGAKPFQVMPLLATGGFDELPWEQDELALACASHGGEPEHVAIAASMLHDIGREEGDLVCGPHEPLAARGARIVRESGIRLSRLHNNCSGKHAAMLALAHTRGWPMNGYERAIHPVQRAAAESVAQWSGVPVDDLVTATDGCGVAVFGLPLSAMARAYARLASGARRGDELASRVSTAIRARPHLFGGTERFDTVLLEATEGRVMAKVGAEGVHCVALADEGVGIALKVHDGAARAQYPAVLRLLQHLGALPDPLPPRLAEFAWRAVRDSRGEVVGHVGARA
ncbi:MAG TPA: asparaginase [Gemmatimonadaceae bacterium]|nr:asparaginase [Gemmatimonadaceae bacterium]